jgi:ribosome-binding ATPase YchF (GTP1/OBG family)
MRLIQSGTNEYVEELKAAVADENAPSNGNLCLVESQISEIEDLDERQCKTFLKNTSKESSFPIDSCVLCFVELLITYFTAGVKEVRAWTIQKGWEHQQQQVLFTLILECGFMLVRK